MIPRLSRSPLKNLLAWLGIVAAAGVIFGGTVSRFLGQRHHGGRWLVEGAVAVGFLVLGVSLGRRRA